MSLGKLAATKREPVMLEFNAACKEYNDYCKLDEDLQSFDTKLLTHTKSIISCMKSGDINSTDFVRNSIQFVSYLSEMTVEAILKCRADIQKKKKGRSKKKNEDRYKVVVQRYLDNSLQLLDFCSKLDRFLTSAQDSVSSIGRVIQLLEKKKTHDRNDASEINTALEKLKKLKASSTNDHSSVTTESLQETIQSLLKQQSELLSTLEAEKEKARKKSNRAKIWKRAAKTIFISIAAASFVCTIVGVAMVGPPLALCIAYGISPAIVTGTHWLVSLFQDYENACNKKNDQIDSMQRETLDAKKNLGNIKVQIDRLNTQIDSIFTNHPVDQGEVDLAVKDIKDKLEKLSDKIKVLMTEEEKCKAKIFEARVAVTSSNQA